MKRFVTTLFVLLGLACTTGLVRAQDVQDVTVRQINAISADSLAILQALGPNFALNTIYLPEDGGRGTIFNDLAKQRVRFTAVVLSNPRNSGLASATNGFPSRIHVFVRDTSAASQGNAGMGIQIVDGSFQTTGLLNLTKGDVITVVGVMDPFNATAQFTVESLELKGNYQSFGLPESILEPVVITTADANMVAGAEGMVQVNWDNLGDLSGQYVRIEGATILARDISSTRPNFIVSSDGGQTVLNFYDTSLRYRNDRTTAYNTSEFNVRPSRDPFVPPPPGAKVNIQGYLSFVGDDPFARATPTGALLSIIPMSDEDLVVTETPPSAAPAKPLVVPAPGEAFSVTADVTADPLRSLTGVELTYSTSADPTEHTVPMTLVEGDTYTAEVPGQADGTFVFYTVTATDNTGAESTSNLQETRVLEGGIQELADLQETSGMVGGDSPFRNLTLPMDIHATVQTPPEFSNCSNCVLGFSVQDDPDLGPNSGIFISDAAALTADLTVGDVIHIMSAEVRENFGVTFLRNVSYMKESTGGSPLPHKEVTTTALKDAAIAEAHEGMLLRFEDAIVTAITVDPPSATNPFAFGEFGLSSDGTKENEIRVDDSALEVPDLYNQNVAVWQRLDFVQGVWWFSFSNWKLEPVTTADIGAVINVANEDEVVPGAFALAQNYPNPFNPVTTIQYTVGTSGRVTLEVVDLLGRTVATLVDGPGVAGTHQVRFDATGLSSGLYLYRLTAGKQTKTMKMMVLK